MFINLNQNEKNIYFENENKIYPTDDNYKQRNEKKIKTKISSKQKSTYENNTKKDLSMLAEIGRFGESFVAETAGKRVHVIDSH